MAPTLGKLATELGERSTYDAASQCSRCGYCEQACPTYRATGEEKKSPRGRNQLVRLMLEGKLSDPLAAEEALSSCLLCGACSTACYAHVPTADIVLEGRRLMAERSPWLARALSRLLLDHRSAFELLLKAANAAKRMGLSRLARPLLRAAGLAGLAEADAHVAEAPLSFLHEKLRSRPQPAAAAWRYFSPCGPRYLYPRVGMATVAALDRRGGADVMDNGCCGLLAYNYGRLDDARAFARRIIETAEAGGGAPIVADCSSCASFLKTYEQLFFEDPGWRERAGLFAARVKDAVEVLDAPARWPAGGAVTYHASCRACHGQGLKTPEALMRSAGEFRPLEAAETCCGGAGAFSFTHPELSDAVLRDKISKIAGARASVVVTSSTSCLIQLAAGLKKYYPSCTVKHISEIVAFSDGENPV